MLPSKKLSENFMEFNKGSSLYGKVSKNYFEIPST